MTLVLGMTLVWGIAWYGMWSGIGYGLGTVCGLSIVSDTILVETQDFDTTAGR